MKYCDRLMFTVWADSKTVRVLSTFSKDEVNQTSNKPEVIHDYNSAMPGVDISDQQKAGRSVVRKRVKKYYKNLFNHLFDTALIKRISTTNQSSLKMNVRNVLIINID